MIRPCTPYAPAMRADGVDEFRAVHHAAPADGNHHIDRLRVGNRRLDTLNRGVRHNARVEAVAHTLRLQLRLHRLRQPRLVNARVRDDERACPTVQTALEAQVFHCALPEQQARRHLEAENGA